ncbi:NS2 rare [Rat parvovirus NTU1]|nr:NS2 rare [Rat parvovirus NTU1]
MAGNQYSEEVLDGVNWLKDQSDTEAFSFVFKCENVQLNGKDINWNNYNKPLNNEELTSLIRGAETAMDQAEDMEWESELDQLTKKFSTLNISNGYQYSSEPELRSHSSCFGPSGPRSGALEHSKYTCGGTCDRFEHQHWWKKLSNCSSEPNLVRDRSRLESLLQSRTVGERLQRGTDLGLRLGTSGIQVPGTW